MDTKREANPGKYVPAHGRDEFENTVRALDGLRTSRTRERIAYFFLGSGMIAMITAAVYGFRTGNYGSIKDVWTVAGPFWGYVVGYYFDRS